MRVEQVYFWEEPSEDTAKVYFSDNGVEFPSEKECKTYEDKYNGIIENIGKIKSIYANPTIIYGNACNWKWYYITSQEDVDTIIAYYNEILHHGNEVYIPPYVKHTWVSVKEKLFGDIDPITGYELSDSNAYTGCTLEELKADLQNILKKLEK